MTIRLAADELLKYAPYNQLREFEEGYRDYEARRYLNNNYLGLAAKAYHLGFECAFIRAQQDVAERSSIRDGKKS